MKIVSIIAGLGNIGKEYSSTRHNIGFYCIDSLLESLSLSPLYTVSPLSLKKIAGEVWKITENQNVWLLCKPNTYMNKSGECIAPLLSYYSLPASSLLIVHDELDISLGTVRMKHGGGDAGHNGLRSITSCLQTPTYSRLRIGIGRPQNINISVVNWVLGKFTKEEDNTLSTIKPHLVHILETYMKQGFEKAKYELNA